MLPTPTPLPSPTPAIIQTVSVSTGSRESLHRLPFASSVLDRASLGQAAGRTSDGALRLLPGFDRDRSNSSFTNYGQLRVSFAGSGSDRGTVLLDGTPAQDGFGGQVDWAAVPLCDLTRAELLRGPGSALYGSGAIGGVLSLETFAPPLTQQDDDVAVSLGASSHQGSSACVRSQEKLSSKLGASLTVQQAHLSYDDLAPGYQSPIDVAADSRASMTSLRLRYAPSSGTSLEYGLRGAWDYQQEGRPSYDFSRNFMQHTLSLNHASNHAKLSLNYYVRNIALTNRADRFPSAPGTLLYTQIVPTHESGITGDWTATNASSVFEIRGDARFIDGVSTQYNASGAQTASGNGYQALGDLGVQETLTGLRDEAVLGLATSITDTSIAQRVDRALSPRLAIRHDFSRALAMRISAGSGFRAPYLNELLRGYVIGPTTYAPNPMLVPERSSSLVGGLDWLGAKSELSIDATRTFVANAIDFSTVSATLQKRTNLSNTRTDGITAAFRRTISTCSSLSVSGTQQYARITGGAPQELGKQLPYVPKGLATTNFITEFGATEASVGLSYLGSTFADDLNQQPLGTATTADASLSIPIGSDKRIRVSATNLANARYLSSVDRYAPPSVVAVDVIWQRRAGGCR